MKKTLLALALALCASLSYAQGPTGSVIPKSATEKNPPNESAGFVDYVTSQPAATILSAPCGASGPPTWQTLCAETMVALGASVATVTAASGDLVFVLDVSDTNALKMVTASTIAALASLDIAGLTADTPVGADLLVFADVGTGNELNKVTLTNLGEAWSDSLSAATSISPVTDGLVAVVGGTAKTITPGLVMVNPSGTVCQSEMFFNAAGNPHGTCFVSGSTTGSGAISALTAISANEPGMTRCLSTAASDKCSFGTTVNNPNTMFFGGGKVRYTVKVSFTTTSDDGTADYTWRGGFADDNSTPLDGVYLKANDDGNGSEFELICVKQSGSTTTIDTNQAIPYGGGTPAFHLLEIEVNAAGTSAQAYYDGAAIGAPCTTNIPVTAADATGLLVGGTVGGTGATSDVFTDYAYFSYVWEYTTPR